MCKIVGREGTASLVVISALVQTISQENERGARNSPPVGRGLMEQDEYQYNALWAMNERAQERCLRVTCTCHVG